MFDDTTEEGYAKKLKTMLLVLVIVILVTILAIVIWQLVAPGTPKPTNTVDVPNVNDALHDFQNAIH